jgi:hypothetical protein
MPIRQDDEHGAFRALGKHRRGDPTESVKERSRPAWVHFLLPKESEPGGWRAVAQNSV